MVLRNRLTTSYLIGMKGFNDFFEVLFDSILKSCRGIELSNTAAFGWRGFRIDKYMNLARCQYYFQINTNCPRELILHEVYNDGRYRYPWKDHPVFDLELNGFFNFSKANQRDLLVEFTALAVQQAMVWQNSEARKVQVPADFFYGNVTLTNYVQMRVIFEKIPPEFVSATVTQNQIFTSLKDAILFEVSARMGRQAILEPNTSWFNWDFRGLRMKICDQDGIKPSGPTPFVWRIYYRQPAVIRFESEYGQREMNLEDEAFLTLQQEQQSEWLGRFVRNALDLISPNSIEIID